MTAHDLKVACPAYKMFNHQGVCERCKHGNLVNVAGSPLHPWLARPAKHLDNG
jgi:hypothetical protein